MVVGVACSDLVLGSGGAPVLAREVDPDWRPSVRAAARYVEARQGNVRFAFIDHRGRFYGSDPADSVSAASVFKVMLLAAYLRMPAVRGRALLDVDRDLLASMIRRSDNAAATRIRDIVGADRIYGLASIAGMQDFELHRTWGLSRTSARDQVRFMYRLERYIPRRHQPYARRLLATIVPSQGWGIPKWLPTGGRCSSRVGGLGKGSCRPPGRLPRVGRPAYRGGHPDHVEPEP